MRTEVREEGEGEVERGDVGGVGVNEGEERGEGRSEGEDAGEGTTAGDEGEEEIAMLDRSLLFLVPWLDLPVFPRSPTSSPRAQAMASLERTPPASQALAFPLPPSASAHLHLHSS